MEKREERNSRFVGQGFAENTGGHQIFLGILTEIQRVSDELKTARDDIAELKRIITDLRGQH